MIYIFLYLRKYIILKVNKDKISKDIICVFIKEILLKQHLFRLEDLLLNSLVEFNEQINLYNKINSYNIAGNIIMSNFTRGFIELYGDIIDGEIPIYHDGELIYYESVLPEEYDNIQLVAYNPDFIKRIIDDEMQYREFDGDLYDDNLAFLYEFALAERNKRNSSKRKIINGWDDKPEIYIAMDDNFYETFNKDENILLKHQILKSIKDKCEQISYQLDLKLKHIFEVYEKE
jgi:hypothetical protein